MQESEEIMAKTSKFENTLMDIADFVDSNVCSSDLDQYL